MDGVACFPTGRRLTSTAQFAVVFHRSGLGIVAFARIMACFLSRFLLPCLALVVGTFFFETHGQADVISLNSDNLEIVWKTRAAADLTQDGTVLSLLGTSTSDWIMATVPGTVFGSAVADGLEKDPNFGDNIEKVDYKKYDRDFWYRTEFNVPAAFDGRTIWLNFDGINKSGDIYLNGAKLGTLHGFMERGHYDVSKMINAGSDNVLAVLVHFPTNRPIMNAASPTYMSCGGWDWMPRVPGLLSGITDKVWLSTSGPVTLADPWIRTHLANSHAEAELTLAVDVVNSSDSKESGSLSIVIQPGNIVASQNVTVAAHEAITVTLGAMDFPQLVVKNPKLWWPNGYGDPNLYSCRLAFVSDGVQSDICNFKFGIREYSYDSGGGVFHINLNGKRIFVKGGNWGMSEYMLRCRGAEYDLKVHLHQDMHMNMIRNWLGSTTDEAFYDACDKYGVMVWDDFWLNHSARVPTNNQEGLNFNAIEKIKRFRNHPCIAVWCGANEGVPASPMDDWFRNDVKKYDGDDRHYQSSSNSGTLSGSGEHANMDPIEYFTKTSFGRGGTGDWGFHTEIGTAVFTTFESFKEFMPQKSWWPRNEMWNKHYFGPWASNAKANHYEQTVNQRYGAATGIEDFCRKAQLVNIEVNKAMYEGWLDHLWNDASGIMVWMSQSAYPSLVWQTYDYYYDLNGAFWGVKKACEPIHIQWNPASDVVNVINTSGSDANHLMATATAYDINGITIPDLSYHRIIDSPINTATECFETHFGPADLAYKRRTIASSAVTGPPGTVTAGNDRSGWSSPFDNGQWIYIDLGETREISSVGLLWGAAYAKSYEVQVSSDAQKWATVHQEADSPGGWEKVNFTPTFARYVKMNEITQSAPSGFSLCKFEVYGPLSGPLSHVHFIKLTLQNQFGNLLSDNFYWCPGQDGTCTELNSLARANLNVVTKTERVGDKIKLTTTVTNPASSPAVAFAIHVQPVVAGTGRRILPVFMNDDYFTLLKGESRAIVMIFDANLLGRDQAEVLVEPYNNRGSYGL